MLTLGVNLYIVISLNFILEEFKKKDCLLHNRSKLYYFPLECARFPEFLQNFSERQILWSLCSIVFHALTLKLPIQTSFSVAPKLPVSLRSGEKK